MPAWRTAGVFSKREEEALRWAEVLTQLDGDHASEASWLRLRESFDEQEATLLTITVGTINAWNRIAGGLRFAPTDCIGVNV